VKAPRERLRNEDLAPRARFGNIHCYNNVIETAKYATISVSGAVTLVESCIYSNTLVATSFSHAKDKLTMYLNAITGPEAPSGTTSGYRTVFNTGKGAGQTVFHLHLHLLGGRDFRWPPG